MTELLRAGFSAGLRVDHPLEAYLAASDLIDFDHPSIRARIAAFRPAGRSDVDLARDAFEFVRDHVHHSWDIRGRRVTARASDVLEHREGLCFAKSHLLAALLRGMGIPAGFCYQRFVDSDEPGTVTYLVHGLNAVYLPSLARWVRVDARGNKPGVDARFSLDEERLAYHPDPARGEVDYRVVLPEPHPAIVRVLAEHDDAVELCERYLPGEL